ncbi:MAG TPA: hypothetical protein VMW20_06370 [Candidatus Nanoarchaeia archaeon]|nr:hypothetical protein [Candidatus Nanoarchaeia archaeon]
MIIRKNIAIDEKHLKYLEPLLSKNNYNLSAAVREAIEFTNLALDNFNTLKEAKDQLIIKPSELSPLEETIRSNKNVVVSHPTLLWFLKYTKGLLIDNEVLEETLDPLNITTVSELDTIMNNICQEFGWQVKVSIFSMDNLNPESVTLMVSEGNEMVREFVALHLAQFFAINMNLDVEMVHKRATSMRIDFRKIEKGGKFIGLETNFGYNQSIVDEVFRKPTFWKNMINIHMITNYKIVSMCRTNFESALAGKPIQDISIIESFIKKHVPDIPYTEFIETIRMLHESMGIVKKVEFPDKDTIKVYHDYKDEEAIHQLTNFYKFILEANGQHFNTKYSTSLIILERV